LSSTGRRAAKPHSLCWSLLAYHRPAKLLHSVLLILSSRHHECCPNMMDSYLCTGCTQRRAKKSGVYRLIRQTTLFYLQGELIGVCGAVGSGKSSLLLAILGQLEMASGRLCRTGTVAYVGQQAWIQNATLKDNILFGETFHAKRFV